MVDEWEPLPVREGWAEQPDALYEGFPPWLLRSVTDWVSSQLVFVDEFGSHVRMRRLTEIERRCRMELSGAEFAAFNMLLDKASDDTRGFLCALDLLVHRYADEDEAEELEEMLEQGGSGWAVVVRDNEARLERRVDEGVRATIEKAMEGEGAAANHIRNAWRALYGVSPIPGHAYWEAVKAVEAAAKPIVLPDDPGATLGKMEKAIREAPHKWHHALSLKTLDPVMVLQQMMQALWQGQPRHGDPDPSRAPDVSSEEAEAAVHLAATLVHWFRSGAVRRDSIEQYRQPPW